jgi:predicted RNA-binding protein with RPS1 domain
MPTEQANIVPGEIIEGKVQGITNFGAFIELAGGIVGLVHISEIADTYVKDVRDFIPASISAINKRQELVPKSTAANFNPFPPAIT